MVSNGLTIMVLHTLAITIINHSLTIIDAGWEQAMDCLTHGGSAGAAIQPTGSEVEAFCGNFG